MTGAAGAARYWTTSDRPAAEQFSYWREVICEAFTPLAPRRTASHRATGPDQPGLSSWVSSALLRTTNCAEVSSRTQLITHGRAEVRRTVSEHVFVNLQVRGSCVAEAGGRRCVVPAGSFALFDTTDEYRLEFFEDPAVHEWRVISFRVPRAALVPLLADERDFTARTHDAAAGGLAAVVASTMTSTWRQIADLDPNAARAAETAVVSMLAATVDGRAPSPPVDLAAVDAAMRAAVTRHLAANLRGSDLSAARVARLFGISTRKLHLLFEGSGSTFARTVAALRIEGCARELADGTGGGTMTELAARWGFCDLSHLNRTFRAHHGCLPREYRDAADRPGQASDPRFSAGPSGS